jgi:hypothetical protein
VTDPRSYLKVNVFSGKQICFKKERVNKIRYLCKLLWVGWDKVKLPSFSGDFLGCLLSDEEYI